MAETLRQLGLDRTRARKGAVRPELTPSQIRGLLADVATGGGVPFIDAASQAAQGNYGQAAISGLLDVPPVKMAGMALAPLIGMVRKSAPMDEALRIAQKNAAKPVSEGGLGLPPDNTPMDRARAMGFGESGYSGTAEDVIYYDPKKSQKGGSGSREGPLGAWLTDDPRVAESFAAWSARGQGGDVIYPLMIRGNKPAEMSEYSQIKDILDKNTKFSRPPYRMMQDVIDYDAAKKELQGLGDYVALRNTKTDSIDRPITQFLVTDPSRIRSRFAAFDPARINENNLLASLAALGIGIPVTRGLLQEEEMQ